MLKSWVMVKKLEQKERVGMNRILQHCLVGLLIEGALSALHYYVDRDLLRKETLQGKSRFVMRYSWVMIVLFLICALLLGGMIVLGMVTQNETFTLWVFSFFALTCLVCFYFFLYCLFKKIIVDDEQMIIIRLLFRKKTIPFSTITRAIVEIQGEPAPQVIKLYSGAHKVVSIESVMVGFNLLIQHIKNKGIPCMEVRT